MRQAACCTMVFIILAFSGPGQAEAWDREAFDEQLIDLCTQHEYREALDLTGQALKDLKRLGEQDEYDMAVCLGVLGELYYFTGNKNKSKEYSGRSMKIMDAMAANDPEEFISFQDAVASMDSLDGTFEESSVMPVIPYYRWKVRYIMKERGMTDPAAAMAMKDLAEAYQKEKQYERALSMCARAVNSLKKGGAGESAEMASMLYFMSGLYLETEQPGKREKALKRAVEVFDKVEEESDPLIKMDMQSARMELQSINRRKGRAEDTPSAERHVKKKIDLDAAIEWFGKKKEEAREKACRANMRVLEGAIAMWEMDADGAKFNSGRDCALSDAAGTPSEQGQLLTPAYVREFPRCRMGGIYTFLAENFIIHCSMHETVKSPLTVPPPGPPPEMPQFLKNQIQGAMREKIMQDIDVMVGAVVRYNTFEPRKAESLDDLVGTYMIRLPDEPWGGSYYLDPGQGVIGSTGPDLKRGTADDTTMSYLPDQED